MGGVAASVPPCTRGINRRDTHGQLGTNICRGFQPKDVAAELRYRHQSGSWKGDKDTTVLMLWTSLLNCTLLSYIHF